MAEKEKKGPFTGSTSQGSLKNPTPKKTTMIDPTGGKTIGYGEDIVPDWTIGKGDKGENYMLNVQDFDEGEYSGARKITSDIGDINKLETDYGDRYIMRGDKIVGKASEEDQDQPLPDYGAGGRSYKDLGNQMMNWAKSRHYENTEAERQAEQNAKYAAIQKAEKKEARKEKRQIRRENR